MLKAIWNFILKLLGIHQETTAQEDLNNQIDKKKQELVEIEEKHDILKNKGVAEKTLEDEIKYWESR